MSYTMGSHAAHVALGHYVPGPLNPPEYYYEPRTLPCGCSEEDCDGFDCGNGIPEVPTDYDEFVGNEVDPQSVAQYGGEHESP